MQLDEKAYPISALSYFFFIQHVLFYALYTKNKYEK